MGKPVDKAAQCNIAEGPKQEYAPAVPDHICHDLRQLVVSGMGEYEGKNELRNSE